MVSGARISGRMTFFTYKYAFEAAKRALEQAEALEEGWRYSCMTTIVFSAFAVEGYINHLCADKLKFSNNKIKNTSVEDKLKKLQTHCEHTIDLESRPFQNLKPIRAFRHILVHPKTETRDFNEIQMLGPDDSPSFPREDWLRLCELDKTKEFFQDTEAMIRQLAEMAGGGDPFPLYKLGHFFRHDQWTDGKPGNELRPRSEGDVVVKPPTMVLGTTDPLGREKPGLETQS